MIRPRSLKMIKKRTPGSKTVIHFRKHSKRSLRTSPRFKKELLKAKVRK
jgi:ribosomal protein L34E